MYSSPSRERLSREELLSALCQPDAQACVLALLQATGTRARIAVPCSVLSKAAAAGGVGSRVVVSILGSKGPELKLDCGRWWRGAPQQSVFMHYHALLGHANADTLAHLHKKIVALASWEPSGGSGRKSAAPATALPRSGTRQARQQLAMGAASPGFKAVTHGSASRLRQPGHAGSEAPICTPPPKAKAAMATAAVDGLLQQCSSAEEISTPSEAAGVPLSRQRSDTSCGGVDYDSAGGTGSLNSSLEAGLHLAEEPRQADPWLSSGSFDAPASTMHLPDKPLWADLNPSASGRSSSTGSSSSSDDSSLDLSCQLSISCQLGRHAGYGGMELREVEDIHLPRPTAAAAAGNPSAEPASLTTPTPAAGQVGQEDSAPSRPGSRAGLTSEELQAVPTCLNRMFIAPWAVPAQAPPNKVRCYSEAAVQTSTAAGEALQERGTPGGAGDTASHFEAFNCHLRAALPHLAMGLSDVAGRLGNDEPRFRTLQYYFNQLLQIKDEIATATDSLAKAPL